MSKRKSLVIAAGVLLAAGAVATVAAQNHRRHGHGFGGPEMPGEGLGGGMERGGFGQRGPVTKSDFEARTRERFARIDRNSDGVLDLAEIEASFTERANTWRQRMGQRFGKGEDGPVGAPGGLSGERMIRRFDENKDGRVTKDEFIGHIRRAFAEMDLNNDGRLTDDDLHP